jgi:hypothetical protein
MYNNKREQKKMSHSSSSSVNSLLPTIFSIPTNTMRPPYIQHFFLSSLHSVRHGIMGIITFHQQTIFSSLARTVYTLLMFVRVLRFRDGFGGERRGWVVCGMCGVSRREKEFRALTLASHTHTQKFLYYYSIFIPYLLTSLSLARSPHTAVALVYRKKNHFPARSAAPRLPRTHFLLST